MKWTLFLGFAFLASFAVGQAVGAAFDHEPDEDVYGDLMQDLDDKNTVRAAGWFKKAFHDAGKWTKKAVNDAGKWTAKAAKDAGKYIKKGCDVVNQIPVKELVYHTANEMREEGGMDDVDEEQLMAAYNGLKAGCKVVGRRR